MKRLPLRTGGFALVDDDVYDDVVRFTWYYYPRKYVKRAYVENGRRKDEALHRRIMGVTSPADEVDHVDGDRLNNTRLNLRVCSRAENCRNGPARRGTSQYKGVSWNAQRRKWAAFIGYGGRSRYIGRFDSEAEAARAYDQMAHALYGDFARLNFPVAA